GDGHDWEGMVVWVDNGGAGNGEMVWIGYWGEGQLRKVRGRNRNSEEKNALIWYNSSWRVNDEVGVRRGVGGSEALMGWEDVSGGGRNGVKTREFGSGKVGMKDKNLTKNVKKGWFR
ncbi:NPP1 family protein, partial [Paenibacillus xylanexedens]|uniref:NPP1 family protein n=1 Tax=Paenibacillus xylanexedens TaxID=528191 RepID=UPI0016426EDF